MTLYLEWEANHRHAEAQRIASERHRFAAAAHDTPSLVAALKRLFGGKGTATVANEAVPHVAMPRTADIKHRKVS